MRTDELDFDLPVELIASRPPARRDASRLLHYRRSDGTLSHRAFSDLPAVLWPGDLLVFNDARVVPARLALVKPTGGRCEGLFVEELSPGRWRVLLKRVGPHALGTPLRCARDENVTLMPRAHVGEGTFDVDVSPGEPFDALLARVGDVPLPPYIRKAREDRGESAGDDAERYQTVYARAPGSVAAPTAGLHFTPELLAALDARGVERAALTLHVGLGTFKPVTVDDLANHALHEERFDVPADTAAAVDRALADGRRVVAVGTTAARVLESASVGPMPVGSGRTRVFITPGWAWRRVGALVTNFHLPRSTLVALVAAFVGVEAQRRIYAEAVRARYRFFSYGDASLLE